MKLPDMKYTDRITGSTQMKFSGFNHSLGAGDGEIREMKNMTGDHWPLLATRARRMKYRKLEKPGGMYCWNKLCWVDGNGFYYDGELSGEVTEGMKSFAAIGPYIVIMPDKCYYNVETGEFGQLESTWTGKTLTFENGTLYGVEAEANAISCKGVNWSDWFQVGDAVTISGCTAHPENNKTPIIREIEGEQMRFYEHIFTLENDQAYTENGDLTVARTVPQLQFMCENENRLWGCDGSMIYACMWGDPFNWNVFDGLESDAFTVSPASRGLFTGGISYKGFAIFSKEEQIYKIYGSVPSSFKAVGSASLGVAEGSGGSMAVAGEMLFFLSDSGMMAYSGGIPQSIGQAFGTERMRSAVAGSDGLRYYVSMQGEDSLWWLYVYDTQTGLWHREDAKRITHFAKCDGNLYMLEDSGQIWIAGNAISPPKEATIEDAFEWSVEFADFTEEDPNKKGVSKLQLRVELEKGTQMGVYIQFDSDGQWKRVSSIEADGPKRSYILPIIPRRCDHYRVKIEGIGGCVIHAMTREFYKGSELKSKSGRN